MTDERSAVEAVALAKLIEDRLLGIHPDEQDLVLEDHDWRLILHALASMPAASEGEVVAYVSPDQLVIHKDPEPIDPYHSEAGRYLPLRKTPGGNFTMPLYAHPAPSDQEKLVGELVEALDDAEDALVEDFMRPDSAMRARCTVCKAEAFGRESIEHAKHCFVGSIRRNITRARQTTPAVSGEG